MTTNQRIWKFARQARPLFNQNHWRWADAKNPKTGIPTLLEIVIRIKDLIKVLESSSNPEDPTIYVSSGRITVIKIDNDSYDFSLSLI